MTIAAVAVYFAVTSVVFLAADAVMLGIVIGPMFRAALGQTMVDGLRLGPAIAFYLLYMAGVFYFAGLPALREGVAFPALINGAVLGLIAYGTYELTSWAVMRDWQPGMVATDMLWGAFVTGISAYIGVRAALPLAG